MDNTVEQLSNHKTQVTLILLYMKAMLKLVCLQVNADQVMSNAHLKTFTKVPDKMGY